MAEGVAQIFNLLYRRFAIGSRPALLARRAAERSALSEPKQVENLRYGRLEVCATRQAAPTVMKNPGKLERFHPLHRHEKAQKFAAFISCGGYGFA